MNKRSFKDEVVNIILEAVKANFNVNRHIETSLTSKNNGFYFHFSANGQQLQLLVYPNGNLSVKVRQSCDKELLSKYYDFREEDNHEVLLPIIHQDFSLLIQDFYKGMDYGTLSSQSIHFSLTRNGMDWIEIYERFRP